MNVSKGPLAGLKILDLSLLIAGGTASSLLADFGAEVIKVERPGSGDPLRNWGPFHNGASLWWKVHARNKKSITLQHQQRRTRWVSPVQVVVLDAVGLDVFAFRGHHIVAAGDMLKVILTAPGILSYTTQNIVQNFTTGLRWPCDIIPPHSEMKRCLTDA